MVRPIDTVGSSQRVLRSTGLATQGMCSVGKKWDQDLDNC